MAPALARGAGRLPVLATRVAAARLRADRVPDHDRRRVGGRLPQQHLQDVRGPRMPEARCSSGRGATCPPRHRFRGRTSTSCQSSSAGSAAGSATRRTAIEDEPPIEVFVEALDEAGAGPGRAARRAGAPSRVGRSTATASDVHAGAVTARTGSRSAAMSGRRLDLVRRAAAVGTGAGDQREDDAGSLVHEWALEGELEILGHPLSAAIASSVPVAYLSARLCDVFPDGTSALVSAASSTSRTGPRR